MFALNRIGRYIK